MGAGQSAETEYRHMHQLYIEEIAQHVKNHIKAYQTKKTGPVPTVKWAILDGDPPVGIIDYAEKNDVSLIIIVSHGRSGVMPWSMGSVSLKVIQQTTKPVLFIRANVSVPKVAKWEKFNKILVPLDGSKNGEAALPYVRGLTNKLKAEITLLQVISPGQHVHTVGGLNYILFSEQQVATMEAEAKQYLDKVGKELMKTKATIRSEVRTGQAAQEIIKFAEETNTSLVAISTHGRSGIRQWISGSITYKVIHAGNTPLLLVRTPEG